MSGKDLHSSSFDEATLAKLEIFQEYTKFWLPTFIESNVDQICVYDFFAGPGFDLKEVPGSPMRILNEIKSYLPRLTQKRTKINVYFNEYKKSKFSVLKKNVQRFLDENKELEKHIEVFVSNKGFTEIFEELYEYILKYPSLIFLDQNGIKFFSNEYLDKLEKTSQTDFLYFLSSSYVWRFGEIEEFKQYLKIDIEKAKIDPYELIHRNLINQIKAQLPTDTKLRLFPFSIKKGANIYGIVFGAKHPRAVEKFLSVVWKKNPINGDANFDIDKDIEKLQGNLFEVRLTKKDKFRSQLIEFIKENKKVTNKMIYNFTLGKGHPITHATECLKNLKGKNINYEGHLKISFSKIFQQNEIVTINWIDK